MIDLSTTPRGSIMADGTVVLDIPCRKCAYNLRGLNVNGRCPECGAPVGFSVQGDYLQFSSPEWLDTLAKGASLFLLGIIVMIVGAIVVGIGASVAGLGRWPVQIVGMVAAVMLTIAWWRLTEPDPSGLGEDRYGTARKLIRIGLVASICDQMLEFTKQAGPYTPSVNLLLGLLDVMFGIMGIVSFFAGLNYLRKLALRVPDRELADRGKFLIWAFGSTFVIGIVLIFVMAFFVAASGVRGSWGVAAIPVILMVIALLVFSIMYLMLIVRLGGRFRALADRARNTWAGPTSPAPATAPVPGIIGQT